MNQPNLFILGAPKCGTAAWYEYLNQHPEIAFSKAKEPHFFCEDFPRFRWAKNLNDYNKLKKSLGLQRLGLANLVRQLNEHEKRTHNKISELCRNTIISDLAEDRRLLESVLGYSIDSWPRSNQQQLSHTAPDTAERAG